MAYENLNPENAFIWRIVHRDNVPWILANGIHCANSRIQAPAYVAIGNTELIDRRKHRAVPIAPGGALSDYVPFYFTPFTPMMYNIYTGRGGVPQRANEEICILVSSLHRMRTLNQHFVFSDRHAYTALANFYSDLQSLDQIPWQLLRARNFQRKPDNPEQIERYQAEALVHQQVPVQALIGVICYTHTVKDAIDRKAAASGINLDVRVIPKWYF